MSSFAFSNHCSDPQSERYDRSVGRILIGAGLVLVLLGVLFMAAERLPVRWGHLPGDIVVRGRHGAFYFPVVTCLLVSVLLSFVMWAIGRWR
jgi:hypothetical protein